MPPLNHFDLLAPIYDRLLRQPGDDRLAEAASLPIRGRLLDAGGGTGRMAAKLAPDAGSVVVADASLKMLRQARRKPGLLAVASRAERLPFPDGCYERVVLVDTYHHLECQTDALADLWRVLAPGGRLVIEEPDVRLRAVRLIALAEKLALMRSHFVPAERIATQLAGLGAKTEIRRSRQTAWVIGEKN
jgi:ubiquinone/menaquinone biosynthesis C-methylase UbiE